MQISIRSASPAVAGPWLRACCPKKSLPQDSSLPTFRGLIQFSLLRHASDLTKTMSGTIVSLEAEREFCLTNLAAGGIMRSGARAALRLIVVISVHVAGVAGREPDAVPAGAAAPALPGGGPARAAGPGGESPRCHYGPPSVLDVSIVGAVPEEAGSATWAVSLSPVTVRCTAAVLDHSTVEAMRAHAALMTLRMSSELLLEGPGLVRIA